MRNWVIGPGIETGAAFWSEEIFQTVGRDPSLGPPLEFKQNEAYYTPESWERFNTAAENARISGVPFEIDAEILRPDGERRWITVRGETSIEPDGSVLAMQGTVQDITARKVIQQALSESEDRNNSARTGRHAKNSERS